MTRIYTWYELAKHIGMTNVKFKKKETSLKDANKTLLHISGQMFTKVGARGVQHNLFSDCDFYENRLSKTHTLFRGVNEFLLPVSSFTA